MTGSCSSTRKVSLMANAQVQVPVVDLTKIASIDDVFLALRTPYMGTRIEVTDIQDRVFRLQITGLYHEDGSGRSLVVSGYAELIRTTRMKFSGIAPKRFEAYLNYKGGDRKGWIKLIEKDNDLAGLAVDHELERAEHAMAHGAHRR